MTEKTVRATRRRHTKPGVFVMVVILLALIGITVAVALSPPEFTYLPGEPPRTPSNAESMR